MGGCHLADPGARVLGVEVTQQSPQGVRLDVVVELENPSDEPLPLVESEYTLTIDSVGEFESADRPHRTMPTARRGDNGEPGRQVIRLPVAYAMPGHSPLGMTYRVEGSVSYRPPGEIRALLSEAKLPLPTVTFNGSGLVQ